MNKLTDYTKLAQTLTITILQQEYIVNNKNIEMIAQENNCSYANIKFLLKQYKIRKRQPKKKTILQNEIEKLKREYIVNNKTLKQTCDDNNWSYHSVLKTLSRLNIKKEFNLAYHRCNWKGYNEIPQTFIGNIKRNAKHRNIIFNITIEDIWNLYIKQNRKCALSGLEVKFQPQTASVDRINNSLGYCFDNIQLLHKDVNIMKWKYDQSQFINWCNKISKFQNNKIQIINNSQPCVHHNKIYKGYIATIRKGANSRNLTFNVTIEYLSNIFLLQKGLCALSGEEIIFHYKSNIKTASLDRIDSSKGYIEGNVQWIHKTISPMKLDYDQNYFIAMCNNIYTNSLL